MRFPCTSRKIVALVVMPALFLCTSLQTVNAAMVATSEVLHAAEASHGDRDRLIAFLNRADVEAVLERWGVEPEKAEQRVDSLTDVELAGFAARLDQLPAGGDGGSTIGAIVGAILLVFLILLLTDLLGLTDVFPFVKKRR